MSTTTPVTAPAGGRCSARAIVAVATMTISDRVSEMVRIERVFRIRDGAVRCLSKAHPDRDVRDRFTGCLQFAPPLVRRKNCRILSHSKLRRLTVGDRR